MLILILATLFNSAMAADCPFNKPYPRSENCLCKGVKNAGPSGMFICEGQPEAKPAGQQPKPVECPRGESFDKNFLCYCAKDFKKFIVRNDRNVCLGPKDKVPFCATNLALANNNVCHCPTGSSIIVSENGKFTCQIDHPAATTDSVKAPPSELKQELKVKKRPSKKTSKNSKKKN